MQKKSRDRLPASNRSDLSSVRLNVLLIGAMVTCSGLFRFHPVYGDVVQNLPVRSILSAGQTVSLGFALLGIGGLLFFRGPR